MGFLSKVWGGIKKIAGAAAMIVAPFIAGPIAGMIGMSGALGTALIGAGIGGLGAGAAGVNPLIGAALGGLGGFAAGGGGAAGGAAAGKGGLFGGLFGGGGAAGTAAGTAATAATAAPAAAGLTAAAAPAAGGFLSGLNIGNLAPLAFAMYGKGPQNLTDVERQNLIDNAQNAAVERGVFDERLAGARSLLQQGEANPERAFAETQMATQRGLRDVERTAALSGRAGLQESDRRRGAIEGARMGTAAVSGEQARAAQTKAAGLSALPTSVPTSASELDKTIYADMYKRRADYTRDLAGGFGQMYGNIA